MLYRLEEQGELCVRCARDVRAMCEFCEWFGDGRERRRVEMGEETKEEG